MMTAGPRVPEELLLWRISSRILSISSRKCQSEEKGTVVIEIVKNQKCGIIVLVIKHFITFSAVKYLVLFIEAK